MKQLAFDFSVATAPTLDNFVVGANAEVVAMLRSMLRDPAGERFVYLWGPPGSGRTHLLRAMVAASKGAQYCACSNGDLATSADRGLLGLDDVDCLRPDSEIALFNLYNALRENGGTMLASGSAPPAQLEFRPDVKSRLAWGLVYEVRPLTDAEKARALAARAESRGFTLQPDVSDYLLSHARRDMAALLATLDALDRYSLEAKRPVTVPLLRELLAAEGR